MRKWLSIAAVVVLCLALVIGVACGGEEEEAGVEKLKWGHGAIYWGAGGAAAGIPFKWATTLAREKIGVFEVAGQQYEWEFIYEENNCDIAGGITSANKLIFEHNVDFMSQHCGDPAYAAMQITEEVGMILFTGAGSLWDYGPDTRHTFQVLICFQLEWVPFIDWVTKEHPEVQTVAFAYLDDRMGHQQLDGLEAICEHYGLELKAVALPPAVVEYYPTATKLMTYHPDLVIGMLPLFKAMWDLGYEGLCGAWFWAEVAHGAVPWDKAAGKLLAFMPTPVGIEDLWPEAESFVAEYEERYGTEPSPAVFLYLFPYIMTQALQKAGTVDDVDKIIDVLETETFDTDIGPMYFGGEALNGIGHILMFPQPIYEVLGPGEYRILEVYSPEEVEALANTVYGVR